MSVNKDDNQITIGFTPEQIRRFEGILRVCAGDGRMQHKNDLTGDALNLRSICIYRTRAALTIRSSDYTQRHQPQVAGILLGITDDDSGKSPLPSDVPVSVPVPRIA